MTPEGQSDDRVIDYITGIEKPNLGAEANRQEMERVLVELKGYDRVDIEVDAPIAFEVKNETYRSKIDLVVKVNGFRCMLIKCAPGSLSSREREVVSAARLLDRYLIPLAIATDGTTAQVWDTLSGRRLGQGMEAVPSKQEAQIKFHLDALTVLDPEARFRTQLIFRSYDGMNVNR